MDLDLPTESLLILLSVLTVLSAFLVFHFASPSTSFSIKLLVVVSFAFGFSGIALLPVDLTITTVYDSTEQNITPNATYGPWQVVYWTTFLLGFVVLPLIRECILSGHFTFRTRFAAGCRKWLTVNLLLMVIGIVFIVGMVIKMGTLHVVPVLMSLANTYGLLLVSLLLGYGLVDLPSQLWRQSNPATELRRTQIVASNADEHLFEAVWELQDVEQLIDTAAQIIGDYESSTRMLLPMDAHYARCVDHLLVARKETAVLSPELQRRRTTSSSSSSRRVNDAALKDDAAPPDADDDGPPSIDHLAHLNRRLQQAQYEVVSAEQQWHSVVQKSTFYAQLERGDLRVPHSASLKTKLWYVWLSNLRQPFYKALAMSSAVLSGMVLWSEATLSVPFHVSPFSITLRLLDKNRGLVFQLAALIPFLYMSICVYSSLFKLSLFGPYRLRGVKMSSGIALVFNAQYLVRLQFPLGYNYLFMIKYDTSTTDCAFSHVMSNMETVPFLGTSFSVYAPLLILALCGFTLCNGYARLVSALGMEHEDAILLGDSETLEAKVNEGITLLRRSGDRTATATTTEIV